ncbi:BamA/TamA family outer membrane protein [Acidobacteria bacterium AH-259-L09]|nr:BamA/TamA family outer membrane protein [Acidobacteria bacterium AH-259-L09]
MSAVHYRLSINLVCWLLVCGNPLAFGQEQRDDHKENQGLSEPADIYHGRIVTPEEVKKATRPAALLPLRIVSYPHRFITSGMEKGLISFEKHHMRQRMRLWTENLRRHGIEILFGGLGEGAGFGSGATYTLHTGEQQTLQFLGRASFKDYQEFDAQWTSAIGWSKLVLEASYQWRPQENFYGLGMQSLKEQRTNFALRQSWTGLHWELAPTKRLRWGSEYKLAWLSALRGRNPRLSSPDEFFPNLPGFGTGVRLQTVGLYFDADFLQSEYKWGGSAHLGASYQDGLRSSKLQYSRYEIQLEGRMPVAAGRSVLIGQANIELNRERPGSDPVPFYLLPHVGGSSTLRGFALDRFYGKNLALLALEYRYRIHPNFQVLFYFDEGQIFNRTSDLAWLNWHRNYGIGLRMLSQGGTALRIEYGWSHEGFGFHLSFGDRERRPLGGPIRYGTYRR